MELDYLFCRHDHAVKEKCQIVHLHAWTLSDIQVLNISFPSLWPNSDFAAQVFISAANLRGWSVHELAANQKCWAPMSIHINKADLVSPGSNIIIRWFQNSSGHGRRMGRHFYFFITYRNRSQRGRMCCNRKTAKIPKEQSLGKTNHKLLFERDLLSCNPLLLFWHVKRSSLTSVSDHLCVKVRYVELWRARFSLCTTVPFSLVWSNYYTSYIFSGDTLMHSGSSR